MPILYTIILRLVLSKKRWCYQFVYVCMYVCMYGKRFQQSMDQPGMVANPARDHFWSRDTGSAVPSRPASACSFSVLTLNLVLTHGIPPDFHGGVHLFKSPYAIGSVRVNRVTKLRTDDVYCRESAGTGSVVLKVVPVTGVAFSGVTTSANGQDSWGVFQGCTGLWPAGCRLARRLHQLKVSTTTDLGVSIFLISVYGVWP